MCKTPPTGLDQTPQVIEQQGDGPRGQLERQRSEDAQNVEDDRPKGVQLTPDVIQVGRFQLVEGIFDGLDLRIGMQFEACRLQLEAGLLQ